MIKKRRIVFLVIGLTILMILSWYIYQQSDLSATKINIPTDQQIKDWRTYTSQSYGFSVKYPPNLIPAPQGSGPQIQYPGEGIYLKDPTEKCSDPSNIDFDSIVISATHIDPKTSIVDFTRGGEFNLPDKEGGKISVSGVIGIKFPSKGSESIYIKKNDRIIEFRTSLGVFRDCTSQQDVFNEATLLKIISTLNFTY